jgi:hypothetical protein
MIESEKVRISFDSSSEDAPPLVTIYNSGVLSAGLTRQIARYWQWSGPTGLA